MKTNTQPLSNASSYGLCHVEQVGGMISGVFQAVMLSVLYIFAVVLKTLSPYTQLLIISWENLSLKLYCSTAVFILCLPSWLSLCKSSTLDLSLTEFHREFFSGSLPIISIILSFFWLPLSSANEHILSSALLIKTDWNNLQCHLIHLSILSGPLTAPLCV